MVGIRFGLAGLAAAAAPATTFSTKIVTLLTGFTAHFTRFGRRRRMRRATHVACVMTIATVTFSVGMFHGRNVIINVGQQIDLHAHTGDDGGGWTVCSREGRTGGLSR